MLKGATGKENGMTVIFGTEEYLNVEFVLINHTSLQIGTLHDGVFVLICDKEDGPHMSKFHITPRSDDYNIVIHPMNDGAYMYSEATKEELKDLGPEQGRLF